MKLFLKISNLIERRKYNIILRDRRLLTDFEREQLIPQMKERIGVIRQYFVDIIKLCEMQKGSREFVQNLRTIINPKTFPISLESDPRDIANAFYDTVKEQAQKEGIDELDSLLVKYSTIENVRQLGLFLTEVNAHCSSFVVVNNRLLLFRIDSYPIVTNSKTGEVFSAPPSQYSLTIQPFQIYVENMIGIAKATMEIINHWHKSSLEFKKQFLELTNTRRAVWIHILSIVLAITLSAVFLFASDPFNLYKVNRGLREQLLFKDGYIRMLESTSSSRSRSH